MPNIHDETSCPVCSVTWLGPTIPEGLWATGNYETWEDAEKAAAHYGWTPENNLQFNVNVVGIQYPYDHPAHYDGVSEWQCTHCKARFNRFTGELLGPGEYAQ